jgi:hypothetical protein
MKAKLLFDDRRVASSILLEIPFVRYRFNQNSILLPLHLLTPGGVSLYPTIRPESRSVGK